MTIPVLFPACGKTSRLDGFGRRSRHDSRGQVLAARPVPLKVEYLTFSVTGPYWKITTETGRSGSSAAKRLPGWTSGARETNSASWWYDGFSNLHGANAWGGHGQA